MYYFIGIKGTGMSALALLLNDLGYEVSGSDRSDHYFTEDALVSRGINIYSFNKENIKDDYTIIKGNVFNDENEEVQAAKTKNLKIYTYQEMLGELSKKYKTITIAGCHGKTTTTTLMGLALNKTIGCNALIGDSTGYGDLKNEFFALEACEYKRHFLEYTPYYAVITNIDFDHADYFKDIDDVIDAYIEYGNKANKKIIACGDDKILKNITFEKDIIYYGIEESNDVVAKNIVKTEEFTSFDVYIHNEYYHSFKLPIFGNHMILNTLAVITISYLEKINPRDIEKALNQFKGAKRRFQENKIKDVVTIDDYAHHPNEIKATFDSIQQKYPNKEKVAVILIHGFSRAVTFKDEFIRVLNKFDYTYFLDIYEEKDKGKDFDPIDLSYFLDNVKNSVHITNDDYDLLLKHKDSVISFMSSRDVTTLRKKFEQMKNME